jgi:hypothetical protein
MCLQDQYRLSCNPGSIHEGRKGVNRTRYFLKTVVDTGVYVPERIYSYLGGKGVVLTQINVCMYVFTCRPTLKMKHLFCPFS